MSGRRVVVLTGVPEIAAMAARSLRRLGHDPVAAVGARRKRPTPGVSSLDVTPEVPGVEVIIAPEPEAVAPILRRCRPDLVLSWAFPWKVAPEALGVPTWGSINCHPSLLPRHRGSNPLAWTIRMGDSHYGLTWHRMDPDLDTGPILAQQSSPVLVEDTIYDVIPRLSILGLRMLRSVIDRVAEGDPGEPQSTEGVTTAGSFGDDYATIDWSMPARAIHDQVRAWSFTPGSQSVIGPIGLVDGRKVRVVRTTLGPPTTCAW